MKLNEIDFKDKQIFISPCNNLIKLDEAKVEQLGYKVSAYVDNLKTGEGIVSSKDLKKGDLLIVISPNYWREIIKDLSSDVEYYIKIKQDYYIKNPSFIKKNIIPYIYKKENLFKQLFLLKENFLWDTFTKYNICLSKNIKKIKSLPKEEQRIFIIGNGPSLSIGDLEMLKNEVSIASNKIFLAFDETSWRPNYYTIVDPLDIEEYYDDIIKHNLGLTFFPSLYGIKRIKNSIYYKYLPTIPSYKNIKCTGDILKGFHGGESVSFSMIDFAISLGSKEIILIGFDHNYCFPKGYEDELYKVSEGESNHFHPDYRRKGDLWTEPRVDNITFQFKVIKEYCDNNNIKIYNATRGGKLEVFPRVDFDSLFTKE